MNTARDHMREDMNKRPEQLQREADDVRSDMEHTVDELANQFSPGALINQAMGMVRGSGDSHFIHSLSTQIQNNPVPALLAGVSLTWLMTASKHPPAQGRSAGAHLDSMHSARDRLSSATDHARSSTAHMSQSDHDMKQRLNDSSHHMMDSARTGARSVRDHYDHMLQDQPLMLGALALAAGAALGALLPRTEAEDHAMGEVSDHQKEMVRQRAEGMKERAESKLEETLGSQRSPSEHTHRGTGEQGANRQSGADGMAIPASAGTGSAPAGTSGPPGSDLTAGAAQASDRTSEEEGVPVANPSSVPKHPDTIPPILNQRDGDKG